MSSRTPLDTTWTRALITCMSYAFAGLISAWLSAAHEPVTPLYLAAGVGLACVLGWGPGALLGVAMGAATVTVGPALMNDGALTPTLTGMALANTAGATLQSWLGAWLVQRWASSNEAPRLALDTQHEIALFMMVAGPLASLVHPAVQVAAQAGLGLMPPSHWTQALVGGWAGHTLGALVAAPMMLTLVGQPRPLWQSRRDLVGIPLLVASMLLVLGVRQVQSWKVEREAAVFSQDVNAAANAVNLRLSGFLDALAAVHGVFQGSEHVSRDEFARVSRYWLHTLKGIQAIGWNERVAWPALPAFESAQRAEGQAGFKVFHLTGAEAAPGPGSEALVVRYIVPRQGNERALGFNVLSRTISRDAFEQARREGRMIASSGFRMIQEPANQVDVVVYHPVYQGEPSTHQERVSANKGAVFLVLRMEDALATMLQGQPSYLGACLVDATEHAHLVLAGTGNCAQGNAGQGSAHQAVVPIEFAGRRWQLVAWNAAPVPLVGQEGTTWLLAVGGAAFAAALGSLLLIMTGHTRRIEEAMEEARRQRAALETANRAKSEFMSRMSHELRTPLNAVLGFAQLMEMDQRDPLPAPQSARVEQIQQAGWHLLDMIDDVLDISRIDMGTLKLQAQSLRIGDELSLAVKLLQEDADKHGVTLAIQPDIPSQWGAMADATRLRQILAHLLSNGIKFNQRGGKVSITVAQAVADNKNPRLLITVHDTGMGMNEQQLSQLFQPFNRLGREQGPTSGTGIGLVISRHLALLMGGQLDVQSEEGRGSTFTLSLPAVTMPAKVVGATRIRATRTTAGGEPEPRHVLYVEDNLANSEVIRSALAARPWITVTVAPTTEEGLAVLHNRLRGSKPDLILLDVHLPDASGQELLKLIKANPDTVDIPVIMISADAMPEQIDAALSAGAACYLTKPVQLSELLRQVDELMPG